MKALLKKRYPTNHRNKSRWVWLVRTPTTDGQTSQCDSVGYWCDSRDNWKPKPFKGKVLGRMTAKDAQDKLREAENQVDAGKQDKPELVGWDDFVQAYIRKNRKTVAEATLLIYEYALTLFGEVCRPSSPRDVDRAVAKRFVQHQLTEHRGEKAKSKATIKNKYLASLRRTWNEEFPHQDNPFVKVARLKSPKKDWHLYLPEQFDQLIAATPDMVRKALYLIAFGTGLRKNEITNLCWADVDLERGRISVTPKADTESTWAWTPKDHDRRTVPVGDSERMAFHRLRGRPGASGTYVFIDKERQERILRRRDAGTWDSTRQPLNNILRAWQSDCARAGIPICEFHSLRKSAITLWLADNVPLSEVKEWAGHESIDTTVRYYCKASVMAEQRARASTERRTAGLAGHFAGSGRASGARFASRRASG